MLALIVSRNISCGSKVALPSKFGGKKRGKMIKILENVWKMLDLGFVDNYNTTWKISKQRPDVYGLPALEPIRGKTGLCVNLFFYIISFISNSTLFPKMPTSSRYQVSVPVVFRSPLYLVPSLALRSKVEDNPWEQIWIRTRTQSGWYNKNTSHRSQVTNAGQCSIVK